MRTTIDIDDDVLADAEQLAKQTSHTVGKVLSTLSRTPLKVSLTAAGSRSGFPLLPMRDPTPVTLEFVNRLRDELP